MILNFASLPDIDSRIFLNHCLEHNHSFIVFDFRFRAAIIGALERDHYDQPGIAFLTVLGVLTTSNWNGQFYNAAADFSSSIIFYYIAWIFIGNWVLFNLFIAILIQGISDEKKAKFLRQEEIVAEKIKAFFFGLSDEDIRATISALFNEADADKSGMIDMNELEFILVKKCGVQIEPNDLIKMFRKYDDDDSGRINLEEFENMIRELLDLSRRTLRKLLLETIKSEFGKLPEPDFVSKTEEYFGEADKDKSGSVDAKEMAILLAKHDIQMMPQDIERLLGKADSGDVSQGHISQKEFTHMIRLLLTEAEGGPGPKEDQSIQDIPEENAGPEQNEAPLGKNEVFDFMVSPLPKLAEQKSDTEQKGNPVIDGSEANKQPPDVAGGSDCSETALSDGATLASSAPLHDSDPAKNADTAEGKSSVLGAVHPERSEGSSDEEDEPEEIEAVVEEPDLPRAARSLFCLNLQNPFRRACIAILDFPAAASPSLKVFDNIILICILISSVSLAFENPRIGENNPQRSSLDNLNLFLMAIFLLECCLKIIADSFLIYIKSGWSKMDFFIVVTSTLDMILTYALAGQSISALKAFRVLRILRALRPLRLIARARSLRILLSALWASIIPIIGTCAIAIIAFAMCSLLGMQLLKGKMKSCSDPKYVMKRDCLANVDQDGIPLQWLSPPLNWDSMVEGILNMFILASQDNWQGYMWTGTDAVSRVEGPRAYNNMFNAVFYVFCLLVSSFLVINLVIGVFVDAYYSAASKLAAADEKKVEPRKKFPNIHEDPSTPLRQAVCSVVTATSFDMFIAFFIVTNVVTMAFESFKQSSWQSDFSNVANIFYTLVFGWECAFKLGTFLPKRYYSEGWNRFDFFIVMISFGGILIDGLGSAIPMDPRTLRVLRLFRIFRILRAFRILKAAKGLARILSTLARSLPALRNLMALLLLLFFVFSVLGVSLFGSVCVSGEETAPGLQAIRCIFSEANPPLDPKINFRDVGHALLALFRVATTDGWSSLMLSVLVTPVRPGIPNSLWLRFLELNGTSPAAGTLIPAPPSDYMLVVRTALQQWKAEAMPGGKPIAGSGWPYPTQRAANWAAVAKGILQVCITDDEAGALEDAGLMDCSVLGRDRPCSTTCTDSASGYIFFGVFTLLSAFFLMQLVIAVLLEQLVNSSDKAESALRAPGCEQLRLHVFARIGRRWRYTSVQKLCRKRQRISLEALEALEEELPETALAAGGGSEAVT